MKTLLHDLGKYPDGYTYQHGEISALDEWDANRLCESGAEEAWYWYAQGSYEGSGQILLRKGKQYDLHDMGHCSCYGPIEQWSPAWKSKTALVAQYKPNADLWKEVAPLFKMANIV